MSASVVYALAFYAATAILVIGVVRKIVQYAKTPAPLKIPTMPAPVTQGGVVVRMASEVVLFNSLFKSNKWIWIFGWMFHLSLLLAFIRHLRYVISPDSFLMPIVGFEMVQAFSAGYLRTAGSRRGGVHRGRDALRIPHPERSRAQVARHARPRDRHRGRGGGGAGAGGSCRGGSAARPPGRRSGRGADAR